MEPLQNTLAGLDYNKCSTDELKMFVAQRKRGRRALRPPSKRDQLIRELVKIDRATTFRFEDMTPELRLHVYEELFDLSPNMARKPNTQVLRSCKMAYREGRPILNQIMNGITLVRIKAVSFTPEPGVTSVRIHSNIPLPEPRLHRPLHEHLNRWPANLEGEEKVLIHVELPRQPLSEVQGMAYLNNQLYFLATRLGPSKTRKVVVHIRNNHCPDILLNFFLWPLSRLAASANLIITGVPKTFERTFSAEVMSADIDSTILRDCVKQDEAISRFEKELSMKRLSQSFMLARLRHSLAVIMSELNMGGVWCATKEQRLSNELVKFRREFVQARLEAFGSMPFP